MPQTVYKLSPKARLVLYYLGDHAEPTDDGSGNKEITVRRRVLAEVAKTTTRNITRIMRRLEALGYVSSYMQIGDEGDWTSNRYVIHPITSDFAGKLLRLHHDKQGIEVSPLPIVSTLKEQ